VEFEFAELVEVNRQISRFYAGSSLTPPIASWTTVMTVNATEVASDTPVSVEREFTDKPTASAVGS